MFTEVQGERARARLLTQCTIKTHIYHPYALTHYSYINAWTTPLDTGMKKRGYTYGVGNERTGFTPFTMLKLEAANYFTLGSKTYNHTLRSSSPFDLLFI